MKTSSNYGYNKALKVSRSKDRKESMREIFHVIRINKSVVIITAIILICIFAGKTLFKKIVTDIAENVTYMENPLPP